MVVQTSACDLQSELALKLKRFIYQALADKQLPYDDAKNADILEKYKRFIIPVSPIQLSRFLPLFTNVEIVLFFYPSP